MAIKGYFDLLFTALPKSLSPDALTILVPEGLCKENPRMACEYALRKCEYLDWDAYLLAYPDIAAADVDPVLHFLKDGIFEGRKLFTRQIIVSVILINCNNELYLDHAINSVRNQSLKDIEIIIVDDCSTDNSEDIILSHKSDDYRIKYIKFEQNSSQNMARKAGVALASGKYLMFLDSDDYLSPSACEIASLEIAKGYDIVGFNTNFVCRRYADPDVALRLNNSINTVKRLEFKDNNILKAMFKDVVLSQSLWNKIYQTNLVKKAFAELEDGYFIRGQDKYQIIAIANKAKSLCTITDVLYNYRLDTGVSSQSCAIHDTSRFLQLDKMVHPIKLYLHSHGLDDYYKIIVYSNFMDYSIRTWLNNIDKPSMITEHFNTMAQCYGIADLLGRLSDRFKYNIKQIADTFSHYQLKESHSKNKRKIGIIYGKLGNGGAERVIIDLSNMLVARDYDVTLFLREKHEHDLQLNEKVNVFYTGPYNENHDGVKGHITALEILLNENKVDVVLFHELWRIGMFWELMLVHYLNIPCFVFQHSDFSRRLTLKSSYDLQTQESILRCADQVGCLNIYGELYYRRRMINARYIHNPITMPPIKKRIFESCRHTIAVICRLGEPQKQIMHCLYILNELVSKMPTVRMLFIGSFVSKQIEKYFFDYIRKNNLTENVEVTGWLDKPHATAERAGILLCTSYWEGFTLSLAEAQARGMPAVIYDLPIMMAKDNKSVIAVPQGDFRAAAREIINLSNDRERWESLSVIARKKALSFSPELYIDKVIECINGIGIKSYVTWYKPIDYINCIKYMSFYASHPTIE